MVDLPRLRRVEVEPAGATATVQGGASFGDAVAASEPFGLSPVTAG